jgi:type I restriction enzyme M protein
MVVEAAFQGSKVFEAGGPFTDIYAMSGHEAKRDERLKNSGNLLRFDLLGDTWGLEPKTVFYDWIYINAIHQNPTIGDQIAHFDGFSDIEFNPEKSFSCQARSAALYVSLKKLNLLVNALRDKENYLEIVSPGANTKSFDQSLLPGF